MIYDSIRAFKYLSVAVLMMILPSESIMPYVGYNASQGEIWLPGVVIAGALGSTIGSTAIYGLARYYGYESVRNFLGAKGKWLGLSQDNADKAARWFDAHAKTTIFFGRFVPGMRSVVSIPAGLRRMPFKTFLLFTALGSFVNGGLLALLGYTAVTSVDTIQMIAAYISNLVVGILVVAVVGFIVWRKYKS